MDTLKVLVVLCALAYCGSGKITADQFSVMCEANDMYILFNATSPDQRLVVDDEDRNDTSGLPWNGCNVFMWHTNGVMSVNWRAGLQGDLSDVCPASIVDINSALKRTMVKKTVATIEGNGLVVTEENMIRWELACDYVTLQNLTVKPSSSVLVKPSASQTAVVGTVAPPEVSMRVWQRPANYAAAIQNVLEDEPSLATSQLKDKLSLVVYIKDPQNYWEFISVSQCWASNAEDMDSGDQVELLSDRCPNLGNTTRPVFSPDGKMYYVGTPSEGGGGHLTQKIFQLDVNAFRLGAVPRVWFKCALQACPKAEAGRYCPVPFSLNTDGSCLMRGAAEGVARAGQEAVTLQEARAQVAVSDPEEKATEDTDSNRMLGMDRSTVIAVMTVLGCLAVVGAASLGYVLILRPSAATGLEVQGGTPPPSEAGVRPKAAGQANVSFAGDV